jgi:hypothetical protein
MSAEFARWLSWRIAALAVVATVAGVVFGAGAVVLVVGFGWAAAIVRMRMSLRSAPRPTRARPKRADESQWPSLDRLVAELTWASTSPRHYDLGLRRILQRVSAARLDDRAGVDLWARRDAVVAEELVGPASWPLIDPARPASADSHGRGVRGTEVDVLLDRLDTLSPLDRA